MTTEMKTHSVGTGEFCLPANLRKPRLRRDEASEYLMWAHGYCVKPATLAKYACVGGGPRFNLANRTPLYPRVELDKWAKEKLGGLRSSTSDDPEETR